MKFTRKIFVALLVVLTLLMSLAVLPASAAEQPETLYLTPNANWKQSNARFAAYFFGNGETWVSMTDSDGDGIYEVAVPADKVYPNVIFCRMNPGAAANNWNNKWNQTADLAIPTGGANHFTVKEGTWDSGGGTWSTFGSSCLHTNLGEEATCTTPQICLDCKDPVVSALGHTFNSAHLCTRCNEQASFTVAGSGAHMGTDWDTGNTANDMTYDAETATYTKVYTNVAAGSYAFKVVRDHSWGTAYPSADKPYTVATDGSTVTITLKGTTVNVVVDAPHVHSYFYPCDPVCQECYEFSNPDAAHNVLHVEAVAATCYENGNIEYWYCSYCGATWADEAQTQVTNQMNVVVPAAHGEAKHVAAVAATCYENGNIEYWYCEACGQAWLDEACTQNTNLLAVVLPMAHAPATHVAAKDATCAAEGNIEYWFCEACGQAWLDEACTRNTNLLAVVLPTIDHSYVDGACSACGAVDPDYEAPAVNNNVIDFSKLEEFPKGTYTDGAEQKFNDIFTFYHGQDSRIDGSSKKFEDGFEGTLRFGFGGKWKTVDNGPGRGLQINAPAAGTVTLWWVSGGAGRSVDLLDASFNVIETTGTEGVASGGLYITTFEIPVAGVYYLTNIVDNNYWFKVEYAEKTETPEQPHVNTLVVGDTNKIVVSGNTLNDANLPIEWVAFVADENAFYSFVGDNGALAFIFDANGGFISATGAANLEAGTYLICLGNGLVGEFNVAVSKAAWVNTLAIGENKLLITDALDNGAGYYIVWVPFEVTEKANYTFGGEGILALVYDSAYQAVAGTELEAGTYNVCVAFLTPATTGIATVKVEKTAIGDEPVVELPKLQIGENAVSIDGTVVNLTGAAIAWYEFTVTEAGTYKVSSADLNCYIYSEMNLASIDACLCKFTGVAELEAGTYYVCVGRDGKTGDFTVTVDTGEIEVPVANTIGLGKNTYHLTADLKVKEYEFILFTAEKDGIYTFSGCSPLTVFLFHTTPYVEGEALDANAPYVWNVGLDALLTDSFEVELKAGIYWVGFRYDGDKVNITEAPVGEYEIEVTYAEKTEDVEPPIEDNPPVDDDPTEEPELNFFEKIWQAILNFFKSIGEFFSNLFSGNKE